MTGVQTCALPIFYLKQVSSAVSPSNFLPTNPELLRETLRQNGENLVRDVKMLASDIEAGKGQLRIEAEIPPHFRRTVEAFGFSIDGV